MYAFTVLVLLHFLFFWGEGFVCVFFLFFFCCFFLIGFFVILILMYTFIVLVLFWLSSGFWCWYCTALRACTFLQDIALYKSDYYYLHTCRQTEVSTVSSVSSRLQFYLKHVHVHQHVLIASFFFFFLVLLSQISEVSQTDTLHMFPMWVPYTFHVDPRYFPYGFHMNTRWFSCKSWFNPRFLGCILLMFSVFLWCMPDVGTFLKINSTV